jgi:TatA/E family protein of Tat protein translocase
MIRRSNEPDPMIAMLSTWEIIAILVVVLLLFGNRLPGMARSLGSGITEFKRGLKDGSRPAESRGPTDGGGAAGNPPARTSDTPTDGSPR